MFEVLDIERLYLWDEGKKGCGL